MRRRWTTLIAVSALTVAACSGGDTAEQILESQEGVEDVEIDEDSGEVSVETDDGSVTVGGGDIPDDFPVPVPSGGEVIAVAESPDGGNLLAEWAGASFTDIEGFYEDWIAGSGLEELQDIEISDPQSHTWTVLDGDDSYTVSVSDSVDRIVVAITIVGG